MALLKSIPYMAIILLLGYIIFLRECTKPEVINTHTNDTIINTIYVPKIDTIYKPYTIYKDTGSTKIVTITKTDTIIDTVLLIQDYLSKVFYKDTILNDSKGLIVVTDTIYQNRIKSRYNQIKLYSKPIKSINHYYIGGGVNGGLNRLGLHGSVGLLNKKKNLYTLGYDFINKEVSLTLYIKLR